MSTAPASVRPTPGNSKHFWPSMADFRDKRGEPISNVWAHYRRAVERIGRDFRVEESFEIENDDSLRNDQTFTKDMKELETLLVDRRQIKPLSHSVDHNSNRYGDSRRVPPQQFGRQLSLDLEDARQENGVLRQIIDEKKIEILKLREENAALHKKVERLSAGRGTERSKWAAATGHYETPIKSSSKSRQKSPESISLSELSPLVGRKGPLTPRRHSTITYSSNTPQSTSKESSSTPRREVSSFRLPLPNISSSTSSSTSDSTLHRPTKTPQRKELLGNPHTPAEYLKLNRPEFIRHSEKRQNAVKIAAATRTELCDQRRAVARAVVEGRASPSVARPFLDVDPTAVRAFDHEKIRMDTKRRFRSTGEFQNRLKEYNENVERAASKLIAQHFSRNTLRRSRSIGLN